MHNAVSTDAVIASLRPFFISALRRQIEETEVPASRDRQFLRVTAAQPKVVPNDRKFLTLRQLRERWGNCSHMLIERRSRTDPRFPKCIQFGKRKRLWAIDEIEAYERVLVVTRGAAA